MPACVCRRAIVGRSHIDQRAERVLRAGAVAYGHETREASSARRTSTGLRTQPGSPGDWWTAENALCYATERETVLERLPELLDSSGHRTGMRSFSPATPDHDVAGTGYLGCVSSSMYRSQLERKRAQRVEAEKRAAAARAKEVDKRAAATRDRAAATTSKSESTIRTKLRESSRHEAEANAAAKESASWQVKASYYLKEEVVLSKRLADTEQSERKAEDRKRDAADKKRLQDAAAAEKQRERRAAEDARVAARLHAELATKLRDHDRDLAVLRAPRQEKLRLLMLASSGEGDLRVGREQKRIKDAVQFASGRDLIALDLRPAATGDDLLNGLTQGRPHIVHFSGHGNEAVVVFEQDTDSPNPGAVVAAGTLAAAIRAVDDPPLLVVLNACSSAKQAERIADGIAAFAIGHSDSITDSDAIAYAARFYASLADGQSIQAAHDVAKAALLLQGTPDHDLPTLYAGDGFDPANTILVLGW